jgi:methylglutamate dehydrogenase subunit D
VAEMKPRFVSALEGIASPGRYGRTEANPGVVVAELPAPGLALVTARSGRSADLIATAEATFGIAPPTTPRRVEAGGLAFVWSGPDRWLAQRAKEPPAGMEALLAPLATHAAIVDESHARMLLRVSGPRVRDALAKGVALDLDPHAFRPGDTAMTAVAHIAVQLWQTDETPTYVISIAPSLAGSFWDWLEASAAEYGLALLQPPPMATLAVAPG